MEEIDTVDSAIGEKVYSSATLDDEFSDNCVLLILTNEASLASFEYNASNFAEIGCASVTNLTQTTTELAKAKIAGIDVSELYSDSAVDVIPSDFYNINTSNFKQVLALELISSGKENVLAAIKTLEQRTDVYYVGPNYLYPISNSNDNAYSPLALTPADTYTAVQWAIDKIHLPDAWSICTGSASVRVGIADSGVDWQHEDLSSRASTSISVFCPSSGNYTTESQTIDITGHGTMVAGIIGATTNNNLGISGVDWNIKLASLRVAYGNDDESYSSMSALAKAIDAAIYYGIPILNISLSYPSNSDKQILRTMIQQYNGLIICCAGNNVGDIDTYNTYYPACFEFDEQNNEHDNIIVVGASTMFDEIWQGSNYGSENVDIFAPGDSIISCFRLIFA